MNYSDYIIYVDESGDHSLESIDPDYPIFSLVLCIFKKHDYATIAAPLLQQFKFNWFGHDMVVLHEHHIVRRKFPFSFLQFDDKRNRFMGELETIIDRTPMTVVAAVIRKEALKKRYVRPENPYQLALLFCLERARDVLAQQGTAGKTTHVICEARSPREKGGMGKEDQALELEFRRIVQGKTDLQRGMTNPAMPGFDIVFAHKQSNSAGLQLADLMARPIGLKTLRPNQQNRAYELIQRKIWQGPKGNEPLYGLKVFP